MNLNNNFFWDKLDTLVVEQGLKIDRPKGSAHPRFSDYIYPHDYGHIADTTSSDSAEIDCWIGSSKLDSKQVNGIIVTFDSVKNDSEMNILINCTEHDIKEILHCHNRGEMVGMLIAR